MLQAASMGEIRLPHHHSAHSRLAVAPDSFTLLVKASGKALSGLAMCRRPSSSTSCTSMAWAKALAGYHPARQPEESTTHGVFSKGTICHPGLVMWLRRLRAPDFHHNSCVHGNGSRTLASCSLRTKTPNTPVSTKQCFDMFRQHSTKLHQLSLPACQLYCSYSHSDQVLRLCCNMHSHQDILSGCQQKIPSHDLGFWWKFLAVLCCTGLIC